MNTRAGRDADAAVGETIARDYLRDACERATIARAGSAANPLSFHGGVEVPVGLTVFKTAGGSLGAVLGGFDSHTPLSF